MGSFELKKSGSTKYRFNLKAGNGEVILTSEIYEARASALNGIESVRTNAVSQSNFEVKKARNGEEYFVLKASNGETIGKSEMYASSSGATRGIASVMKNAPTAGLKDLTGEAQGATAT